MFSANLKHVNHINVALHAWIWTAYNLSTRMNEELRGWERTEWLFFLINATMSLQKFGVQVSARYSWQNNVLQVTKKWKQLNHKKTVYTRVVHGEKEGSKKSRWQPHPHDQSHTPFPFKIRAGVQSRNTDCPLDFFNLPARYCCFTELSLLFILVHRHVGQSVFQLSLHIHNIIHIQAFCSDAIHAFHSTEYYFHSCV